MMNLSRLDWERACTQGWRDARDNVATIPACYQDDLFLRRAYVLGHEGYRLALASGRPVQWSGKRAEVTR